MTTDQQRAVALSNANERRIRIAAIRRGLRHGTLPLRDVLMDPPADIANWTLADLVRLGYQAKRSTATLETLGKRALRDGVNLMCPVGRSSLRSRTWLADNVTCRIRANRTGVKVHLASTPR